MHDPYRSHKMYGSIAAVTVAAPVGTGTVVATASDRPSETGQAWGGHVTIEPISLPTVFSHNAVGERAGALCLY
jgi:hypothetical protein